MSPRIFAVLALLPIASTAAMLNGRVVKVADGDTITVLVTNAQHKVRLNGIDAPEKGDKTFAVSISGICVEASLVSESFRAVNQKNNELAASHE